MVDLSQFRPSPNVEDRRDNSVLLDLYRQLQDYDSAGAAMRQMLGRPVGMDTRNRPPDVWSPLAEQLGYSDIPGTIERDQMWRNYNSPLEPWGT